MPTIYQCQKCREEFDERDASTYTEHTPSEAWGVRETVVENFICCPFCGCKDMEEVDPDEEDDALAAIDEDRPRKSELGKLLFDIGVEAMRGMVRK